MKAASCTTTGVLIGTSEHQPRLRLIGPVVVTMALDRQHAALVALLAAAAGVSLWLLRRQLNKRSRQYEHLDGTRSNGFPSLLSIFDNCQPSVWPCIVSICLTASMGPARRNDDSKHRLKLTPVRLEFRD